MDVNAAGERIEGQARIELHDLLLDTLIMAAKRVGLASVFVATVFGLGLWYLSAETGADMGKLTEGERRELLGNFQALLVPLVLDLVPLLGLSLLIWAVVFPAIALWRLGRDRRTFTWVVDEAGIHRTDAMGAASLLPWSNIQKVRFTRRMLWFKLRPNGWRFLIRRAFSSEDQAKLERLAMRMVS